MIVADDQKQLTALLPDIHFAQTVPICDKFLNKSCQNPRCTMIHYDMPYLWCISDNGGWQPFDKTTNRDIEFDFGQPEKDSSKVSLQFWTKLIFQSSCWTNFIF